MRKSPYPKIHLIDQNVIPSIFFERQTFIQDPTKPFRISDTATICVSYFGEIIRKLIYKNI